MHGRTGNRIFAGIALGLLSAALLPGLPKVAAEPTDRAGCGQGFLVPEWLSPLRVRCSADGFAGTGRTNTTGFVETHLATTGSCAPGLQGACRTEIMDANGRWWELFATVRGKTESRQMPLNGASVWQIRVDCGCYDLDSPD